MTRRFSAHFTDGLLVPGEKIDLPQDRQLQVIIEAPKGAEPAVEMPRYDDPDDPMPAGGVELIDWWVRHRIPAAPGVTDKIARSKAYEYDEERNDET